jgi:ketosteroid isomerase-like protein
VFNEEIAMGTIARFGLVVALLGLSGAGTLVQGQTWEDVMRWDDAYAKAVQAAFTSTDPDGLMPYFAENAVRVVNGNRQEGKAAIRAAYVNAFKAFKNAKFLRLRTFVDGNAVVAENTVEFTDGASGKPVKAEYVRVNEYDPAGKVKASRVYIDTGMIQRQITGQ